jgi:hypothetical protein
MDVIEEYCGSLKNPNDMEPGPVKDAYVSWREQRTRCYNKRRDKWLHYGGKGIQVKYTSRQFIAWWLKEIKTFYGDDPTIGRIDHDGHYEFGNIEIISRSENSTERNIRKPSYCTPIPVDVFNLEKKFIRRCSSKNEAMRDFSVDISTITRQCEKGDDYTPRKVKYIFRYAA